MVLKWRRCAVSISPWTGWGRVPLTAHFRSGTWHFSLIDSTNSCGQAPKQIHFDVVAQFDRLYYPFVMAIASRQICLDHYLFRLLRILSGLNLVAFIKTFWTIKSFFNLLGNILFGNKNCHDFLKKCFTIVWILLNTASERSKLAVSGRRQKDFVFFQRS